MSRTQAPTTTTMAHRAASRRARRGGTRACPGFRAWASPSRCGQAQQSFEILEQPARRAGRRVAHHQVAMRVHDVNAGRAVDGRRELREEVGRPPRYTRRSGSPAAEAGLGAGAGVHEDALHAIRVLVEREPHPAQLLEERALARAAVARDRTDDGPAALEGIRGRGAAVGKRERPRPRACAAGRSACPAHSRRGASPTERYSTMAVTTGTMKSEATSRSWRRPRRLASSGELNVDSPRLSQAEDEPDRGRERGEGEPLHGIAEVAVGRRAGHDPVADVAVRHAGVEQHLARREFAPERGRELRHARILHEPRPARGSGALQPDARRAAGRRCGRRPCASRRPLRPAAGPAASRRTAASRG